MNSSPDGLYETLVSILEGGETAVLARILAVREPGPRRPGAALLVTGRGRLGGTVGGGPLEEAVCAQAGRVLREGRTALLRYEARSAQDSGCGGEAQVFLEPLFPEDEGVLRLLRARNELVCRGGAGLFGTRILEGVPRPPRFLFTAGGGLTCSAGALPEELRPALAACLPLAAPRLERLPAAGGAWLVFLEPVVPGPLLVLLGAGHIAAALAPWARRVGFRVRVAGVRPGDADPARFPDAERVADGGAAALLAELAPGERPFILVAGPSHEADRELLAAALQADAAYVGMVGSRRKREAIFQALRRQGVAEEALARVRCPAGLPIGAETPEEIAVSIVAQLVLERSRGEPSPRPEETPPR